MPGLERRRFIAAVDGVFNQACDHMSRDGIVFECLYGFNPRADLTVFISTSDPASVPAGKATAVTGPLQDSLDRIKASFRENKVVAAIHYGEAWMARETISNMAELAELASNIRASEHPDRIEVVFAVGYWPREFLTIQKVAVIHRPKEGPPVCKEVDLAGLDPTVTIAATWVNDVLPRAGR